MRAHYIILATCKIFEIIHNKKVLKIGMYKKYCGLCAQKMPPGGLRACVACRHILFGLWGTAFKKMFFFRSDPTFENKEDFP